MKQLILQVKISSSVNQLLQLIYIIAHIIKFKKPTLNESGKVIDKPFVSNIHGNLLFAHKCSYYKKK